jgi:hypothetical protein
MQLLLLKIFECPQEIVSKNSVATEKANGAFESMTNGGSASSGQARAPKTLN